MVIGVNHCYDITMKDWITKHKILSGVIAFLILAVTFGAFGADKTKQEDGTTTPSQSETAQQTATQAKPQPEPSIPNYDLVGEYGQGGRVYVISPADATEDKLTLIGKDLNKRFGAETYARIGIYTDKTQAQILSNNPIDAANLDGAAADAYDKAYVAQFNVNKNSGLKQYVIYLNGSQKEIDL